MRGMASRQEERLGRLLRGMAGRGVDGLLVAVPENSYYLSGFQAITYSRPVLLWASGDPFLVVPELEEGHARERSLVRDLAIYSDLEMGRKSPLRLALDRLAAQLRGRGVRRAGFEPAAFDLTGHEALREAVAADLVPVPGLVEKLRMVKDEEEIGFLREMAAVADAGIEAAMAATRPGATEVELAAVAYAAMAREAVSRRPLWRFRFASRPVSGAKSAIPHTMQDGKRVEAGDVVIHETGGSAEGYYVEVERTCVVGVTTVQQERLFAAMLRAFETARDAARPGVACSEVDRAARAVLEEEGLLAFVRHRTGHGLGLHYHEPPYFSAGDETVLEPGMVMSVEPGIYVPGVGGFRHSDTFVVTERGLHSLSHVPLTLPSLTLRA